MGLSAWRDLTPTLIAVSFFASLGSLSFGYDNGWWGTILGATYFNDEFGSLTTDGGKTHTLSSQEQSSGTALGTAGIMIGCLFASQLNEAVGRKNVFVILGGVGIIGALIQATSTIHHSFWQLIAGKIILNISVGLAASCVGVYLAECSPPSARGFLLGFYSISQNIGYIIAAGTTYGVVYREDSLNWMLPICLQFIVPSIIMIGSPFLPESPRWLVSKGRNEEAASSIRKLRGLKAGEDSLIEDEVMEIQASYEEQRRIHHGVGWIELFKGANRRRTLIAIGIQCLQQAQGVSFVSNFLLVLFEQIGIQNAYLIVLMIYVDLFVFSFGNFILPDKFGRRTLLLVGSFVMTSCMLIVAAVSTVEASPTGKLANLLIASIFIWVAVFSCTWSSMIWTICGEISSNPLREKTMALSAFCGFAVGLIINFVVPYIQNAQYANLGGQIGYIWFGFSFISWFFAFFFVPETKNRTLEELDHMFEARVPTRQFSTYDTSAIVAQKLDLIPNPTNIKKAAGESQHIDNPQKEYGNQRASSE